MMELQKDNFAPMTQKGRIELYFENLRGEISSVLKNESQYLETIQKLQTDLSVYKRAYTDVDNERHEQQKLKEEAEKQKEDLENQLKGHRIIALLDGDGAIFSNDLIAQGQAGGHAAAQKLSDSIMQYLSTNYGSNQYQLWVYVFFNKRGLVDTFGRAGLATLKIKFKDFMMGFNQAAERFLMVDVGTAKEAADAKIKAHLEDDIRLPQTFKVLFGGCHDNGYVTTLRSQITAGFKQKLILLRSYTDMAAGIAELELPTMTVPDLFMTQKLVTHHTGASTPSVSPPRSRSGTIPPPPPVPNQDPPSDSVAVAPPRSRSSTLPPPPSVPNQDPPSDSVAVMPSELEELPMAETPEASPPKRPAGPLPTYSSAVSHRAPTPELDSSGSSASSDISDPPESNPRATPTFSRTRHINPNIALSKHKPPPCTLFYLANCKHGTDCKYAHDYLLHAEHFEEIRVNAKKAPCPSINRGEPCIWGEACCYGHVCPLSTKCHYLKQGRCKFTGVDMHRDMKGQMVEVT